jgi:hypothetical protein
MFSIYNPSIFIFHFLFFFPLAECCCVSVTPFIRNIIPIMDCYDPFIVHLFPQEHFHAGSRWWYFLFFFFLKLFISVVVVYGGICLSQKDIGWERWDIYTKKNKSLENRLLIIRRCWCICARSPFSSKVCLFLFTGK